MIDREQQFWFMGCPSGVRKSHQTSCKELSLTWFS
ncbi:hypothetical protein XFF7766_1120009 [Xanthomonas citri pv. fuscans]|nr:hypothetical protein XFF7766_1120009 [Xanthomonas citri pv. fuscans]